MTGRTLRLDIVSDIVCPWCLIGLATLETALESLGDEVATEIVFHPFQLNPGLPPGGEPSADNVARKYGITPQQARERGGGVRAAAAEAGVSLAGKPDRIYDTFDAHRLLHWARLQGRQLALKHALFDAYFGHGRAIDAHDVLLDACEAAALSRDSALHALASGAFATEVHDDEIEWRSEGITSVPTVVIDREFTISGAQDPTRWQRALRKLSAR